MHMYVYIYMYTCTCMLLKLSFFIRYKIWKDNYLVYVRVDSINTCTMYADALMYVYFYCDFKHVSSLPLRNLRIFVTLSRSLSAPQLPSRRSVLRGRMSWPSSRGLSRKRQPTMKPQWPPWGRSTPRPLKTWTNSWRQLGRYVGVWASVWKGEGREGVDHEGR